MNKRTGMVMAILFAALAVFFAPSPPALAEAHLDAKAGIKLRIGDDNIERYPGEDIVITLDSNRTTGYGWEVASPADPAIAEFVKSEYVPNSDLIVGSGGREIWSFHAVSPGKTKVSFKYVRPWEKDVPPAKTEEFTIIVKKRPQPAKG